MSIAIEIRYPWGKVHATPWGRHTNEGATEWPPAPRRILRALYATWATRHPELDEATVLSLFERLTALPEYGTDEVRHGFTRHYLAGDGHTAGNFDRDLAIDAFISCRPDRGVIVEWPCDLEPAQLDALSHLVGSVPFLGRADSLCDMRMTTEVVSDRPVMWAPLGADVSNHGEVTDLLAVTSPLDLDALVLTPAQVRSARQLQPGSSRTVPYAATRPDRPRTRSTVKLRTGVTAVRFLLDGKVLPHRRHSAAVAHVLRQATLSRRAEGSTSALTGKRENGEALTGQHQHAHYLVFGAENPDVLDTALVWAPGGLSDSDVRQLATLRFLRSARIKEVPTMRTIIQGVGAVEDVAPELCRQSTVWQTSTPFVATRYPKRGQSFETEIERQVQEESARRGIDRPTVSVMDRPWREFRRHRPDGTSMSAARPGRHLKLTFQEPQVGPIALGGLSHFSLGLFLPTME